MSIEGIVVFHGYDPMTIFLQARGICILKELIE
jgi:hypothetical protein